MRELRGLETSFDHDYVQVRHLNFDEIPPLTTSIPRVDDTYLALVLDQVDRFPSKIWRQP